MRAGERIDRTAGSGQPCRREETALTETAENAVGAATRVVLVEDHPVFRKGLVDLLHEVEDLRVCGEAADAAEGSRVIDEVSPDLVLMDLSLPHGNALPLVRDLRNRRPALRILVVSMHEERMYAERALRAGADGYITKAEAVDRLIEAIREVLAGRFYLKPEWAAWLLRQSMRGPDAAAAEPEALLSDRELEVFTLLGQGYATRRRTTAAKPQDDRQPPGTHETQARCRQ